MTDFKEEQNNEIEALESIYTEELEILEARPYHKFTITVKSDFNSDSEDSEPAILLLSFQYTKRYPEEPPLVLVEAVENIEDSDLEELRTELDVQWLNSHIEGLARRAKEAEENKKRAEEEVERKKFEGTRVSVESFLAWKAKYDAELAALKSEREREEEKNRKPSGRELFLRDATLNESDLTLVGESEVAVDETLFQDLDDLDLDDENDEDYDPTLDDDSS